MSFFDTTPLGRILNRFSKDIYNIDEVIPKSIDDFLSALLMVVSVVLVVSITTPVFIVVILPLGIFYWFIQVWSLTLLGLEFVLLGAFTDFYVTVDKGSDNIIIHSLDYLLNVGCC